MKEWQCALPLKALEWCFPPLHFTPPSLSSASLTGLWLFLLCGALCCGKERVTPDVIEILTFRRNAEQNPEIVHGLFHSSRCVLGWLSSECVRCMQGENRQWEWRFGWSDVLVCWDQGWWSFSGVGGFGKGVFFGLVLRRHTSFAPRTSELPSAGRSRSDNLRSDWFPALYIGNSAHLIIKMIKIELYIHWTILKKCFWQKY